MSQEKLAVVREVVEAWNRHDLERWIGCWDAGCEWLPKLRGAVEGAQTYRGHDGLRRYWAEDEAVWRHFHLEPHRLQEAGDEVVLCCTGRARGKESGVEIDAPLAFRFRVRDGAIVRGESYLDANEAFAAAGADLPDPT
jgi:ketosteroid isomerase-like protein